MQKLFVWSVLSALVAAVSVRAQSASSTPAADAHFFVQPSVVVAFPGDFDTAAGGAVALGVAFAKHHSVEVEGIYFTSTDNYTKIKFAPIIATYKYTFPIKPRFSVYVGASLGVVEERLQFGYYYGRSHDDAFAGGATGGVRFKMNEFLSLDAGVKALQIGRTNFTTKGSIGFLQAGLNIHF